MYSTLNAERSRKNLTWKEISEKTGIKYATLTKKIYDGLDFTLEQAVAIKDAIGVDMPIEELFKKEM